MEKAEEAEREDLEEAKEAEREDMGDTSLPSSRVFGRPHQAQNTKDHLGL